ncbi:MAG: hypothetical protein ABFC84_10440 [Veillonellales bacterium]
MDTVAQSLALVQQELDKAKIQYTVSVTHPTRKFFKLQEDCLYVIRQHIDADGIYHLVAAGKMGKEVF